VELDHDVDEPVGCHCPVTVHAEILRAFHSLVLYSMLRLEIVNIDENASSTNH